MRRKVLRQQQIFRLLKEKNLIPKAKELAKVFGVTQRTVQSDLAEIFEWKEFKEYISKSLFNQLEKKGMIKNRYEYLEADFYKWLKKQYGWHSFNGDGVPDFWDGENFIEIKRASFENNNGFSYTSKFFPKLFFKSSRIDSQIKTYPKPLLVIVYDTYKFPPREIGVRFFTPSVVGVVRPMRECDSSPESAVETEPHP